MKIRVLIVEDNSLVAEALAVSLTKHSLEVVDTCDSGEHALEVYKTKGADLVIMDIKLAGKLDGISTAMHIQAFRPVPVVYLTDHVDQQHVDRAKETYPAAYLEKPYNESSLLRTIEIAFNNAQLATRERKNNLPVPDEIYVRTDNQQFVKIPYQDIMYLQAERSYCKVVTANNVYTLSTSMNHVHENFDNPDFIRVHRSYVVNKRRIVKLDGNIIHMEKGKVDMGKEYRDELMNSLKLIK